MKKVALHWQIMIGMILGVLIGLLFAQFHWGPGIIQDWVKPVGKIFINLLKLIAVPLVVVSLAKGISDLKDMASLSRIGGRTIGLYLFTTVVAVSLGLLLVNTFHPGSHVSAETLTELSRDYTSSATSKMNTMEESGPKGPLDFFRQPGSRKYCKSLWR